MICERFDDVKYLGEVLEGIDVGCILRVSVRCRYLLNNAGCTSRTVMTNIAIE